MGELYPSTLCDGEETAPNIAPSHSSLSTLGCVSGFQTVRVPGKVETSEELDDGVVVLTERSLQAELFQSA